MSSHINYIAIGTINYASGASKLIHHQALRKDSPCNKFWLRYLKEIIDEIVQYEYSEHFSETIDCGDAITRTHIHVHRNESTGRVYIILSSPRFESVNSVPDLMSEFVSLDANKVNFKDICTRLIVKYDYGADIPVSRLQTIMECCNIM